MNCAASILLTILFAHVMLQTCNGFQNSPDVPQVLFQQPNRNHQQFQRAVHTKEI